MKKQGIIFAIIFSFILPVFFFVGIFYIFFISDLESDYYDYNYDYLEEIEKQKEIELEKKIKSRNYVDETFNPYFASLSDDEKQVYYDILELANSYSDDFIELTYSFDLETVKKIFYSVLYDNPEIFWVQNYYYNINIEGKVDSLSLFFYDENKEVESRKNELDSIVDEIITEANKYSSDYEKEKYVHDLLANRITYDKEMHEYDNSYSPLVTGKAVCSGYSKAFQLIMRKLNIPTFYIVGESIKETEENIIHAWNKIYLDGTLYNVDVTWDDTDIDSYIIYDYFNTSDEIFNRDHKVTDISYDMLLKINDNS